MILYCQLRFCYALLWGLCNVVKNDCKSMQMCLEPDVCANENAGESENANISTQLYTHWLFRSLQAAAEVAREVQSRWNDGNSSTALHSSSSCRFVWPLCVFCMSLPFRDARPDGPEEACPGGEAPCRCQSCGLHPHHCTDCCELPLNCFTKKKTRTHSQL